jgi:glycosyltransferase XagB
MNLWASLPLVPLYYLLASAAAWLALYDLISRPYHWHKTEHGLAKTSRQGNPNWAAPYRRSIDPVRS